MNTLTIPALKTVVLYRCDCDEMKNTITDRNTWTVVDHYDSPQDAHNAMWRLMDDLCATEGYETADATSNGALLIHPDRSLIAFTIEAEQPR